MEPTDLTWTPLKFVWASTPNASIEGTLVTLPLCHEGVCDDAAHVFHVHVNRMRARDAGNATRSMLWMLTEFTRRGLRFSSALVVENLFSMFQIVGEYADVYTLHFRGDWPELLAQPRINSTSAAMDLVTTITKVRQNIAVPVGATRPKVFVYASQLHTAVIRRLMQLEQAKSVVDGYFLDSVVADDLSQYDEAFSHVAEQYLRQLDGLPEVRRKFGNTSLVQALQNIFGDQDRTGGARNECVESVPRMFNMWWPISENKDRWLHVLARAVMTPGAVQLLPAIIYRFARCSREDRAVITGFLAKTCLFTSNSDDTYFVDQSAWPSIILSEMWRNQSISRRIDHLPELHTPTLALGLTQRLLTMAQNVLTYERDHFAVSASEAITLGSNTSVVIWSSIPDPLFPASASEELFERIDGASHKALIKSPGYGGLSLSQDRSFMARSGATLPFIVRATSTVLQRAGWKCANCLRNDAFSPFDRDCGTAEALKRFVAGRLAWDGVFSASLLGKDCAESMLDNETQQRSDIASETACVSAFSDAVLDTIITPSVPLAQIWMGIPDAYEGWYDGLWCEIAPVLCFLWLAVVVIVVMIGHWTRPTSRKSGELE